VEREKSKIIDVQNMTRGPTNVLTVRPFSQMIQSLLDTDVAMFMAAIRARFARFARRGKSEKRKRKRGEIVRVEVEETLAVGRIGLEFDMGFIRKHWGD
jgi:hypothetical protein